MAAELLSATILLILVLDPFGNVPLVAAALAATPAERRVRVVLRECLIAYAVLLARNDTERRVMINTVGPVWDGNEVWVLVAGGAL